MQIGLLFTQRCNAACTHCTTSCGPNKTASLSKEKILSLMDEAAAIHDGQSLIFSLSGGEPFLDFRLLIEIVTHGKKLGGQVTCVSNGYWASSDTKARAMLAELKASGLVALGISTSRYHQRFVKLERAKRALATAIDLGIGTVLKFPWAKGDEEDLARMKAWAESVGVSEVEAFPTLPYVREDAKLGDETYVMKAGLPAGRCPAPTLTIREDGTAYTCCSPGGFVSSLALGNVAEQTLQETYNLFLGQGKQKLLREQGPIYFAKAIQKRGLGHLLRSEYVGACDLCAHICGDQDLSQIMNEIADGFEELQFSAAAAEV